MCAVAKTRIDPHRYVIEYIGEWKTAKPKQKPAQYVLPVYHRYAPKKQPFLYLDATMIGNFSRYITHDNDPNCFVETWICDGKLRIMVKSLRTILVDERVTLFFNTMIKEGEKASLYNIWSATSNSL